MKFQFKIQQYQTDAVNSVVDIFEGQPYLNHERYIRDLGIDNGEGIQTSIEEEITNEFSYGFENAKVQFTRDYTG